MAKDVIFSGLVIDYRGLNPQILILCIFWGLNPHPFWYAARLSIRIFTKVKV